MIDVGSLLHTDFVGDRFCTVCGDPPELYCFRNGYIGICSGCTAGALSSHQGRLSVDLLVLESAAVRSAAARRATEDRPETVDLDVFWRCHDCGRLIQHRDARYPFDRFKSGTPPHCISCYEKIMAGGPVREVEAPLFADLAGPGRAAAAAPEQDGVEPMGRPLYGGQCADCGEAGSTFAYGYQVLICCPACVANSLKDVAAADGNAMTFELQQLLREARKEVRDRQQGKRDAEALTLTCRCGLSTVSANEQTGQYVLGSRRAPSCSACFPRLP
jgi:hypothetical protein